MIKKEKGNSITQQRLKEVLSYNEETGKFTWLISKTNSVKVGSIAGCSHKSLGYIVIRIDGKLHYAHRLAWLYVHGHLPNENKLQIDHIDGDRANNTLYNLKESTSAENNRNQRRQSRNTSGSTGVHLQEKLRKSGKISRYWVTSWYDTSGKLCAKCFSIEKNGESQAKQLAINYRNEKIQELEVHGIVYSSRHGS